MSRTGKIVIVFLFFMGLVPILLFTLGGDGFIHWVEKNEAIWLFCVLYYEAFIGTATLGILIEEFFYDKWVIEKKGKKKKKHNREKVKIEIDHDGNASILEAPRDLDVSIDHLGKD